MGNGNSQLEPTGRVATWSCFQQYSTREDAINLSNAGTVIHFVQSSKKKEMTNLGFHNDC
jgi:hypothetical protein